MVSENPVILVVEDDAEMNELQRELLALHGMDSVPAYNGREAVEMHRSVKPDAILLDVMLPEMDGFAACRAIRQEDTRGVPIIMLTAMDSPECRQKGIEAGADGYFIKPFDPDEVVENLQALLIESGKTRADQ